MRRTLHYALRRLLRARAFSTTAVLTLALGIGGATAVFTIVDSVLLEPLPYPRPDRLVEMSHAITIAGITNIDESDATYLTYRAENRSFSDVGVYRATAVNLGGLADGRARPSHPQRVNATFATAGVFNVLGSPLERGRAISDDDTRPGAPPVVVLSSELWNTQFNADPNILGKRVAIDGVERSVIGITKPSFQFPNAGTVAWLPLTIDPTHTKSAAFDFKGIGRLRSGVSIATATRDLARVLPDVPSLYPGRLTAQGISQIHMTPVVRPLRDAVVGDVGKVLWIILGAVGVLLLVACSNVANLFLARAEGRRRELAVRTALGAARGALLVDALSEGLVASTAGGLLGIALAMLGLRVLESFGSASSVPRLAEVHMGPAVVLVAIGLIVLTTLLVSTLPLLRTASPSLSSLLTSSGGSVGGRMRHGARRALVVAQVAMALVLLAAAGLLGRSFAKLRSVEPGFAAQNAMTMRMALPRGSYATSDAAARTVLRVLDAVRTIGDVQAVGVTTKVPLDPEARQDSAVFIEDRPLQPGTIPPILQIVFTTPGYFKAMGIPIVAGRNLDAPDPNGAPSSNPPEVLVSDAFAKHFWKGESAIGKRIKMNPTDPWHTIVGVVGSVHDVGLEEPLTEAVYCPLTTTSAMGTPYTPRDLALVVRSTGDPTALSSAIRRAVEPIDPNLPLYHVMPATALLAEASARTTFTTLMLGIAAIVALCIGAVGIYGVISYLVALRTREIGVRIALGATPADMRSLITRQALTDGAIGVVAGLAAAVAATRVMSAVLFDVRPSDPWTLAGAAAVLLATALAASWMPARRAAALDPASTLRAE